MSIQWVLIAGCMYAELVVTIFLLLPFISPSRWHSFFKSRFLNSLSNLSGLYFKVFLAILVVCFLDAIREMTKYSSDVKDHGAHTDAHAHTVSQHHMRLFRAQRNFYISGFSLFLCFIIYRLMTLISNLARSQADCEAAMKQAKSASAAAEQLLSSSGGDKGKAGGESPELKELKEQNKKMLAEKDAALKQAESVSREYDRLMKEMSELQKQAGQTGDKKDD